MFTKSPDIPDRTIDEEPKRQAMIAISEMLPKITQLANQSGKEKIQLLVTRLSDGIRQRIAKLDMPFDLDEPTNTVDATDSNSLQALIAISKMISGVMKLADKSCKRKTQLDVIQLGHGIKRELEKRGMSAVAKETHGIPADMPEHLARNIRVIDWGIDHNHLGKDIYEVQGSMISATIRPAMKIIGETTPLTMQSVIDVISDATYCIIKGAAQIFDPERDSDSFLKFLKPMVLGGAQRCLKERKQVIPEIVDARLLFELASEDLALKCVNQDPNETPKQDDSKKINLMIWARKQGLAGENSYSIRRSIISRYMPMVTKIAKIKARSIDCLSREDLEKAGFKTLKGLSRMFNPEIHGEDFWGFAEKYVTKAMDHCIKRKEIIIPNNPPPEFLEKLLTEEEIDYKTDPDSSNPPRQHSAIDINFMRWATEKCIAGRNLYQMRRNLLLGTLSTVSTMAISKTDSTSCLPEDDLQKAGNNTLKGLVRLFDPEIHGEDFWEFAEPYVTQAMDLCIAKKEMVIPGTIDSDFLKSLLAQTDTPMPKTKPQPKLNATPKKAPPPPPSIIKITEYKESDTPPKNDPPPKEPVKDLTPEEQAEQDRQNRFCKWAKDEHGIDLGPDKFEAVVATICDMHESLAKGVVRSIDTSQVRGGTGKVRKMAIQFLPRVVMEFDPQEAKMHFNQFVQTRLKSILEVEIRK